jgi:alkaline phosphatase D
VVGIFEPINPTCKNMNSRIKFSRRQVLRGLAGCGAATAVPLIVGIAFLGLSVALSAAQSVNLERLQYGQQNRHHITLCAEGEFQAALDYATGYLSEYPNDLEAYYILAMAQANLGQQEAAVGTIRRSLEKGLTFDRFLAGPRDLLAPLYGHEGFKELAREQDVILVHGPVLGAVTDRSARFWVRVAEGKEVSVSVHGRTVVNMRQIVGKEVATGVAKVRVDHDNTAVVEVTGLESATHYAYFVAVDGRQVPIAPAPIFTTHGPQGEAAKFEIVFGGGAGFSPWNERMWTTLDSRRPAAALLLGDNVYIDTPEVPQTQQYCYYRRQSRPEYRRFAAHTPVYAIWDDHDFGKNDCVSSLSLDDPPWKMDVLKVFT